MIKTLVENDINIEDMIYEIRGKQVMLDRDLARLYNVETFRINEAVKNNPNKFPERFCFRISDKEANLLISKNSISKRGGSRKGHNVFTEQGVAMLATILKSDVAVQVSINIMDAFVSMKKYISTNLLDQQLINNMVLENYESIKLIKESLFKLEEKSKINSIYFNGQIYDAYSKIVDIMSEAKDELIVVDRYADKSVLDMISNIKCKVILVCNGKLLKKIDIDKYNNQYNNLNIVYNDTFHDRFIFIDRSTLYHCGTSINNAGFRTFAINKIEDEVMINSLLIEIEKII